MSVAVIAAYLAFFPVAVGVLRGLQSPAGDPGRADARVRRRRGGTTLVRLRLPASVPYLLPALRLAAAAAVVGAVVAEISTGTTRRHRPADHRATPQAATATRRSRTPRSSAPPLLGLVAAGLVGLLELALRRYRPVEATA